MIEDIARQASQSDEGSASRARCKWGVACIRLRMALVHTYDQVTDDDGGQEERYTRDVADQHAVPHRFDPLSAQNPEYDHEGVHEIGKIPPGQIAVRE